MHRDYDPPHLGMSRFIPKAQGLYIPKYTPPSRVHEYMLEMVRLGMHVTVERRLSGTRRYRLVLHDHAPGAWVPGDAELGRTGTSLADACNAILRSEEPQSLVREKVYR